MAVESSNSVRCDRISQLDEDVKAEILSCLPTKEAVRTCVLSKAWLMTWTWMVSFFFDDEMQGRQASAEEKEKFCRLVQKVLQNCSLTTIRNFSLTCSQRNLKTLYITRVLVANENDPRPGELTFFFPLLEELTMMCCVFHNVTALIITAPLLCVFQMAWCSYENGPDHRVENFIVNMASSTCLKTFKWAGSLLQRFVLPRPPTVFEASMDHIMEFNDFPNNGIGAAILLGQLSSLVHLELSIDIAEAMARAGRTRSLPIFENLTSMKVESRFIGSMRALMELLRRTPNVQVLDIHDSSLSWRNEDWEISGTLPFCVMVKLRRIHFSFRFGSWIRIELMKLIVRNALSLELLHIDAPHFSHIEKTDIRLELLLARRASKRALIVVE